MSGVSRKRSRPSAEDANNSFVMSVTSKVTGLLPATITKWFSGSSQTNSNGSAPTAEVTDSSSEDEPEMASPITQPPQKRTRFNTPNHYNTSEANCVTFNNEATEPSFNTGLGQSPLRKFPRDPNLVSTPFRHPNTSNEEAPADRSERDTNMSPSFSYSTMGPPVVNKRKSLFNIPTNKDESIKAKPIHNTIVDAKQPCFKPSLLVSPFYPSRTTYGGASSQYINRPNIKQRKGAYVNELNSNDSTAMSQSAKRVMDLLEDYSSPIMEAKRIPHYNRSDSIASSSPSSSNSNKSISYKTTELHAPNIASILRLKQKSRLMNTTNAARQIIASHSSACHYSPYTLNPNRSSQVDVESRSKSTTTDALPSSGIDKETTATLPPVSLPTVVLQISKDNLPKFTFGTNLPNPEASSTPKPINKMDKPTPTVSESPVKPAEPKTIISKPEPSISEKDVQMEVSKPKDWECSDCWVKNKPDVDKCVCCGGKKPIEGKKIPKCSICKLKDSEPQSNKCTTCLSKAWTSGSNLNNTSLVNSVKSSKWKCNDCWAENEEDKEKCACCGWKNPNKSSQSSSAAPIKAVADSDWTCADCWIKNKSSVEKCAACGGAKPGSKQNASALPASLLGSNSKPLVSSQSNKWECTSCLVRNDNDKVKCVCCESERPGAEKNTIKTTFNFGTVNNTFKFGIDPKVQEANLAKAPAIKPLDTKVSESETNNNVLSKAPPTFSFGIPAKKPEDQIDSVKNITPAPVVDSPLVVQKTSALTVPDFTAKKSEIKQDDEKPQEVPKVEFSLPAPTSKPESKLEPKPFGAMISASPLVSTPNITLYSPPTTTPCLLNPIPSVEKKDTPTAQLPFQLGSTTTSAPSPPQNKFVFSGAGLKPAVNLFSKPASPPSTVTLSFASPVQSQTTTPAPSLFQKPEQTGTPAMSLFQKSDPSTNSALSMFQKPAATTTAAAPSVASTAPVFSFGTGNKPASTFSFGSTQPANVNEPAANNSFKFFGSTPDKNTSSNKFNLGGVTTLGASNSLTSGNILGHGNGLSSGNTLGTSSLPGANLNSGNNEIPVHNNQNDLKPANSIQSPTSNIFGAPAQKENIWSQSSNASNNLFNANTANSLQKPGAFTFGASSTPFGAQANNPTPASTPFGAQPSNPAPAPVFGSNAQPNLFGMGNQNANSTRSLFGTSSSAPSQPNLFGAPQPTSTPNAMGMFGSPSTGAANTFGAPSQTLPSFDSSAITPSPAPAFNFGAPPSQSPVVFGFGQQQQQQQPQQPPVYSFGASPNAPQLGMGAGPQVQFNMGSAPPNSSTPPAMRRVRKAVRRNTPR
ncbi:nuclear pore complex protein Nup153 isoform X2 [Amyelois transitella]|uniref:nuclear pore complex protein Nup153 isoform X2 n=1 Tax=Amyelois transitella TaxID=680683 RepID=UPI00067AA307|nr:nuclear pore complex protein Nup153 isoform X2 [Amyelois transitella]